MVVFSGAWPYDSDSKTTVKQSKRIACEICGQVFVAKQGLQRHQFVHTKEKPFECSLCPKKFTRPSNLAKHMAVHSGEAVDALSSALYQCYICGRNFTDPESRTIHVMQHLDKPDIDKAATNPPSPD